MNILILSASTGGGHNRAAGALKDYIEKADPSANVTVVDALEECSSVLNFTIVKGYKTLVTLTPGLFGMIYKNSDKKSPLSELLNIVYTQCAKGLERTVERYQPDAIISCHPFAGAAMGYMKEKTGCTIPLITIVTDFLPHRAYLSDGVDAYVTASDKAAQLLHEQYGVDSERIYDYGHPVYDRFYEGNGRSREEVLTELGLDLEKRTVLVMAGSFGVSEVLDVYESLLDIDLDYQLIVITGKNKKLYDAFEQLLNTEEEIVTDEEPEWIKELSEDNILRILYNTGGEAIESLTKTFRRTTDKHKPTRLFYFVDNVDDYMHASDLIVTKPGGLTTSESIASALPMAVFKAYPGQEEQNAALLKENNIGVIIEDAASAKETVGAVLKDSERLLGMRDSCRRFVRKNSAGRIYELAKKLAGME